MDFFSQSVLCAFRGIMDLDDTNLCLINTGVIILHDYKLMGYESSSRLMFMVAACLLLLCTCLLWKQIQSSETHSGFYDEEIFVLSSQLTFQFTSNLMTSLQI